MRNRRKLLVAVFTVYFMLLFFNLLASYCCFFISIYVIFKLYLFVFQMTTTKVMRTKIATTKATRTHRQVRKTKHRTVNLQMIPCSVISLPVRHQMRKTTGTIAMVPCSCNLKSLVLLLLLKVRLVLRLLPLPHLHLFVLCMLKQEVLKRLLHHLLLLSMQPRSYRNWYFLFKN